MTSFKGLDLWNAVEAVDKSYTKPITGREFSGNSVNLTYTTRKLTEALGPAGDRWGWEVMDEKVHEYGSHELQNFVAIHSVRVRLWFRRDDGTTGHIEDYGTTKLAYYAGRQGSERYLKVDEEATKKSISDAKSKLFVALGGSAQLWLGEFDRSQHKYIGDDDDRPQRPARQAPAKAPEPQRDNRPPTGPLPPRAAGPAGPYGDVGEHTFLFGKQRLTGPEWLDAISRKARDPATDPKALQAWWTSEKQMAERARFHKIKHELNPMLEAVKQEVLARFPQPAPGADGKISPDQAMRAG